MIRSVVNAGTRLAPLGLALLGLSPAMAQPASGAPAPAAPAEIVVIGTRDALSGVAGSGATIEAEDLERSRIFTVNEALRQVPGVYPRDEEGLGLRPNIGIRGLSPTRSSKVLLLEDGLPLTYAPYGDNASYSHPPIRRFARIEVLKGAAQIRFGPNTVGGVINYITPRAPDTFEGQLQLSAGSNTYGEVDLRLGGPLLGANWLMHLNATDFDGVRANHDLNFRDFYLKGERDLGRNQRLIARIGYATEDSQVSYSGLTQAEFTADPFANPFPNDRFVIERFTTSVSHGWQLSEVWELTTSVYSLWFDRDWWRQSSNSAQRPADASDPGCGGMANLLTTCGNEGRLREYNQYGIESRLLWNGVWGGVDLDLETGVRQHWERQNRLQVNGDRPTSRSPGAGPNAGVRELNRRYAEALSGFVSISADFGRFELVPGVRVEHIDYERVNALTGQRGTEDLTEVIPGLGLTFAISPQLTAYAGVHRGFSPPRVEDILTNAGGAVTLDPERSINAEIGLRGTPIPGLHLDVGGFWFDFDNQIVPASVAGGVGATLTSAGETRHLGAELSLRGSLQEMGVLDGQDVFFRTALTFIPQAEYVGRRTSAISGFSGVSVSGNRLPYAPEWIGAAAVGYARGDWLSAQLEVQYTGPQFTDDLNTIAPSADGQRGRMPGFTVVNATVNLTPASGPVTVYATVKNLFDEVFIVDRSRGILPGAPRLVQVGLSYDF